jgi:DNA-binding GntR family transcriptional regulator
MMRHVYVVDVRVSTPWTVMEGGRDMQIADGMKPRESGPSAAKPARERVYAHVREQILRGNFAGGSFIEEEQISSVLGISRTPVREAFHRLEAERFIDLLPRRGALVRQVTAQELVDLYETRRMIEGYAVARICQQRIPVPPQMTAVLEQLEDTPFSDHFARVELNQAFHFAMVAALGNEVLSELYQSLGSRQQRVAMTALRIDPNRIERIRSEHYALLDALQTWDEARARAVLEQHLRPIGGVVSRLPGYSLGEAD